MKCSVFHFTSYNYSAFLSNRNSRNEKKYHMVHITDHMTDCLQSRLVCITKKDRAYARSNLSSLFPFLFLQEFHFRTEGILDDQRIVIFETEFGIKYIIFGECVVVDISDKKMSVFHFILQFVCDFCFTYDHRIGSCTVILEIVNGTKTAFCIRIFPDSRK